MSNVEGAAFLLGRCISKLWLFRYLSHMMFFFSQNVSAVSRKIAKMLLNLSLM